LEDQYRKGKDEENKKIWATDWCISLGAMCWYKIIMWCHV